MKTDAENLLSILGDIPDSYVAEAAPGVRKKRRSAWIRWSACAAACLAVAAWAALSVPPPGADTPVPGVAESTVSRRQEPESEAVPPVVSKSDGSMPLNELSGAPSCRTAMFALLAKDFQPMTDRELLRYFGVTMPVEDELPSFRMQQRKDGGIYKSNGRGVYYDANTFLFQTDGAERSLRVTLAKALKRASDVRNEFVSDRTLIFTKLKGRSIAVFHYTDENGGDCCYAEFVQNGVAYYVTARNLTREDCRKALSALLLKDSSKNGGTGKLTGTVAAVDSSADILGVTPDGGRKTESMTVNLPKGEAAGYSLGDKVCVTYTGEPAAVFCIWKQQLVSIEKLKE